MLPLNEYDVAVTFSRARAQNGLHSQYALVCMSHERLRNEVKGSGILILALEDEVKQLKERLKGGVLK